MCNFKHVLLGISIILLTQSCVPTETSTSGNEGEESESPSLSELRELRDSRQTPQPNDNQIILNYKNESSGIQISLDPDKDQFFLDLKGMQPAEKDTVFIADSTLIKQRTSDIREVLSKFRKAQDLFYLDEYTEALRLLNETLELAETADAYALKGTIHFMMGNRSATRENWNKAVQINPDLPIPSIPELETIIEDIKSEDSTEGQPADTTGTEQSPPDEQEPIEEQQ